MAARPHKFKAAKPDAKIRQDMEMIDDSLQKLEVRHRPPQSIQDSNGANYNAPSNIFPARLTAYDPRDTYQEMKILAPDELGQKFLTDEDLKWMDRKRQNAQYAEYITWAEQYFDLNDPAQVRIAEELIPELYEAREAQIDEVADIQKTLAKIRLRGVRSKQDLMTEFAVNSGKLKVPKGAIYDWKSWYTDDEKSFFRGLFNPRRSTAAPKGQKFSDPDGADRFAPGAFPRPGSMGFIGIPRTAGLTKTMTDAITGGGKIPGTR